MPDLWGLLDNMRNVPFFGDKIGRAIENWSNPVTQFSRRNPILSLIKGEGDWTGADKEESSLERNVNNANMLAALIYGGGSAMGAFGGGGSSISGLAGGGSGGFGSTMSAKAMGSAGADTMATSGANSGMGASSAVSSSSPSWLDYYNKYSKFSRLTQGQGQGSESPQSKEQSTRMAVDSRIYGDPELSKLSDDKKQEIHSTALAYISQYSPWMAADKAIQRYKVRSR